ncbi:dipeptide/oligopeptide/nickel ABC transporter ATP-binding protein [Fictibacillus nanhaiensis]|uniref:ABC transporter ATP-binding protein n=1 Tax=Fictibacillus nanhaiensis TaxID=742169 RepID=UPI001C93E91C|nr:dipeptide/oligopeptide/nickel ABC transporter ATP-binding protein [Fictibacillus nanhaiensis]MBY6038410.1 dipeptide/oligopeptide/nickel ABC transporter ATP-binding protein [Fictibacillus nanhaiensis]
MSIPSETVIEAERLSKRYKCGHLALDDVSLTVKKGECLGIAGESGSGKSTLARCLLAIESQDIGKIMRNGTMQAVFQNPSASLNPKLKVIDSLMEPLDGGKIAYPSFLSHFREDRRKTAEFLLKLVDIPGSYLDAYPHQLSGGQKQRISIARAISVEPSLIILDEPTSSLDVSVQANILNLLKDLQEDFGLSYLFISHDLAAVRFMSQRIAIMQRGKIVEHFASEELFSEERHPCTQQLIAVFES